MNFNKLHQCYKPIFFKLLFHNMFIKSEKNIYNKLLKISSYRIFPYVQAISQFSTSFLNNKIMSEESYDVGYSDIIRAQKDRDILIIDVREKDEIGETGKIPGSINIPMSDVENTLINFSNKEFKNKFNKEKPSKNTKIIFCCRAGRRSGIIQKQMQKLGYKNTYNYAGGWRDWERRSRK
ncbi:rhodanese domain-containing protein CG4456 isoform X1 [Apis florea]|uniref:rhodanese domain-containing protein CG4456 isoform X1 n=1 Tax=Apis florea TaxID=7463 RepID=UPI0012FF185D|nr:rhodanese domain-containing protein CG4456 isoform X1 [Apis florea]